MVVRKKLEKSKNVETEEDADTIINRGGAVSCASKETQELFRFTLRGNIGLLKKIDKSINQQELKISRNQWILEAIIEKLH